MPISKTTGRYINWSLNGLFTIVWDFFLNPWIFFDVRTGKKSYSFPPNGMVLDVNSTHKCMCLIYYQLVYFLLVSLERWADCFLSNASLNQVWSKYPEKPLGMGSNMCPLWLEDLFFLALWVNAEVAYLYIRITIHEASPRPTTTMLPKLQQTHSQILACLGHRKILLSDNNILSPSSRQLGYSQG